MKIPIISGIIEKKAQNMADDIVKQFLTGADIGVTTLTPAGVPITTESAMHISTFWNCVKILTEDIATVPCFLYKETGKVKEKAVNHPLYSILRYDPNPDDMEMTRTTFFEAVTANAICWGKAYIEKIYNNDTIYGFKPLLSRYMQRKEEGGRSFFYYTEYKKEKVYYPDELIIINGLSFDGKTGLSVIAYARESLGLTAAASQYGSTFFGKNSIPGGVIKIPSGVTTAESNDQIRNEWNKLYQGGHGVAVLRGGMDYTSIGIPPEDSQFLETRTFQKQEVCEWFKMPPYKVGYFEKGASYKSVEQQALDYVMNTLRPWYVRYEDAFEKGSLSVKERKKFSIRFNMNALLRGDYQSRTQGYHIMVNDGIMTRNEVRELEEMPPIEGGDIAMANGNFVPITATPEPGKGGEGNNEE